MAEDPRRQMVALLPRLRRFAYALTGSQDEGDDLAQATCERALDRLNQWQPGTRLDSWMFRIAKTIWIDRCRARNVRGPSFDPEHLQHVAGEDGRHIADARLMLERTRQAIQQLPEDQRAVLALVSIEGLPYKEAAAVLDVPLGTVMSRLARARRALQSELNDTPVAVS